MENNFFLISYYPYSACNSLENIYGVGSYKIYQTVFVPVKMNNI